MTTATPIITTPTTVPITGTTVQTISRAELVALLMDCKGATPVTFIAETEPKMRKTGNPFLGVTKIAKVNGMVNFSYDLGVMRRLEKEGKSADDFKQGTSWHVPVMKDGRLTPLCEHKDRVGQFYVRFMFIATVEDPQYFLNGKPIDAKDVEPFLPPKRGYANQGLDKPLIFLTYSLDDIRQITFNKQTYQIR
jgi:hypothetical protein